MVQQRSYWSAIGISITTLLSGLRLTFKHLLGARHSRQPLPIFDNNYFSQPDGISTIQYPHQVLPVPDNGRYRLHNEIDDCIVCDKCAKICPVNCIEIEPIKATEEIGKTSDGTSKRIYAARFDIDMGKCCFCGLCTTVCPTECLTMTKVYDFSVADIREHIFPFAEMSAIEIAEKKSLLEQQQKAKAAAVVPASNINPSPALKPSFKPKIKPGGAAPPAAS
jgi:formate hydrogenlyase subunit 6/NADH:ubiquinone oxidoreductase subunit I